MKKLLILFLFISSNLFATNYYVKNGGSDEAAGTSDGAAWATIAKVNASFFSAGDTIFFNKGDIWREMLTIPSSGSGSDYIVFTSYGTGANPIILGSNVATTWTETGTANVWQSATSLANPYYAFGGNIFFLTSDTIFGDRKVYVNLSELVNEYDWCWNSNVLYVYAATDPDARYTSIEASQRTSGIDLNNNDHIEINGFDIHFPRYNGIETTAEDANHTGLTIRNCEISWMGEPDGSGYGVTGCFNNLLIEYCKFHDIGRRGVSLNHYTNNNVSNLIIQNNIFYNGYHTTGVDLSTGSGSYTGNVDSVIIRNNLIYDDINTTAEANSCFLQGPHGGTGAVTNVYFYNNIIKYPAKWGVQVEDVDGIDIYNNTFYGNNGNHQSSQLWFSDGCTDVDVKNNIFHSTSEYSGTFGVLIYILGSEIELDYNLYYRVNTRSVVQYSSTDYGTDDSTAIRALGWEINGVFQDAEFTDAPTDLTLAEGSPAIAAGVGVGLTTDYAGNAWGTTPSIGAYEYNSTPPTPTDLPEVTTTEITSYNVRYATGAGNVTSDGGGTITSRGVCWSTSANPTTASSKFTSGGTTGTFSGRLYPLKANTTYHYRSFAVNESGTSYGADQTFTTPVQSVNTTGGKYLYHNGKLIISR